MDGWMGAYAPSPQFGPGNLKSSLQPSPGGALTTCECARMFLGWPEWAFSSYLLFYLAALLIKTIFDSCHALTQAGSQLFFVLLPRGWNGGRF